MREPHTHRSRTRPTSRRGAAVRLAALLPVAVAAALAAPAHAADPLPAGNARRDLCVDAYRKAKAAVVNIHSQRVVGAAPAPLGTHDAAQNRVNGMGTGIVIDPRGYIVTNHHVVEEVNTLNVHLHDGAAYPARVIGRDAEHDLALLKIETTKPLATITLGTAQGLMELETVIAIGNAYGYEHTATVGRVSHVKRDVTLNKEVSYKSLIQTDAAINPGNSGGPLLNVYGELVGVNVAIRAGAQCISFAIPVDQMIQVVATMLGSKRKAGLVNGLTLRDVVDAADNPVKRSLVVEAVEAGSPAAEAGFKKGDVFQRVNDMRIANSLELERALLDRPVGEKAAVSVLRTDGKTPGQLTGLNQVAGKDAEVKLSLTLVSTDRRPAPTADLVWRKLGVRLAAAPADFVTRVKPELRGGLTVTEVNPSGLAAKAGFQPGDILVGLHQWETLSPDNVMFVLTNPDLASFNPLQFYIIRGGQVRRGHFLPLN